jgi:RNA polymerase sigma-70 factor (sigma-E family)
VQDCLGSGNSWGVLGRLLGVEADQALAASTQPTASDGFDEFVLRRRAQLIRLAWAITRDRELAEDVTQIALERLWRRWATLPVADAERWAYAQRVLISQVSTWRRRLWTRNEIPTGSMPQQVHEAPDGDVPEVLRWLADLPPRQRSVVVLRYLSDLSIEETARVLGCSAGTVKSQTSKAMVRLRLNGGQREVEADG